MPPHLTYVSQEQIGNYTNLLAASVMLGGAPAFGVGYLIARRQKLMGATKIYAWSGGLGVLLILFFMWLLHENGPPFGFCTTIGLFFGIRYGGEKNERRAKRRERRQNRL